MSFDINESFISLKIPDLEEFFRAIISPEILEKAMLAALDEVERQVGFNFDKRQGEWKPLALSTQYQRLRQGYGPTSPILIRSSTLKKNAASGREVKIEGEELRGDVFPNDDATPPYGSTSIGDYMETLDKTRAFYDLNDEQMEQVYAVMENTIASELGPD